MPCGTKNTKRRYVTEIISNEEILKLRLTQDEKLFYTELFYDNSKGGKVSRENFYPLLGALGTQISKEFSDLLFSAFSSNKNEITICEYLKYIDVYHYGDDSERCKLTCSLMDPDKSDKINLKNFTKYINLIMNAVKKVTYNSNQELMSQKDIKDLFYHISKQKEYFTYKDFLLAYRDKPELISWFDYFKSNKSDLLITINNSIRRLLNLVNKFLTTFMSDLIDILDNKKKINVKTIIENVMNYSNNLENERKKFLKKISQFNIRWALEQSNNIQNETQQLIKTLENKFFKFIKKNNTEEEKMQQDQDKIGEDAFQKYDNKCSIISSNSKSEKLINTDKIKMNRDYVKKTMFDDDLNYKDSGIFNSQNNFIKTNEINYKTPNLNSCLLNHSDDFPSIRAQTSNRIVQFFNDFKEELTKNKSIAEKEEEDYKNSEDYEIDERINPSIDSTKNVNNIYNNVKEFNINENEKCPTSFHSPYGEKGVLKEDDNDNNDNDNEEHEKHIISEENENSKINYINNYNNNIINLDYNTNKNNNKNSNKEIIDINKIKLNFSLKDTYKSDDQKTIYNNSDVDSEYTILDDKMIRDDNIIFVNSNKNANVLIKESLNKNFSYLKQLLLCSRTVINNAHDIIQTFSSCYQWISENYLKEHIRKKLDEDNKEKQRKDERVYNTKNNIARKKKAVKKKIIRTPDESFKILLNIIMGIQIAVQSCPNFRINRKEEISNYLNNMIYSIQTINFGKRQEEIFFLKEFAGIIFNNIRLLLGIDKDTFIISISPQEFVTEIMISSQTIFEELCSTGKSGSLFYYTRDGRFIVKTISKKEYKFLKKILVRYYNHLKDNPLSFLPKFLGCYKLIREIKKKKKYNIYFIVMINVFATSNHVDKRYDLKGSKIGRKVLKGTLEDKKILDQGDMALKDLDFEKKKEKIYIGKKKDIIITQLEKDVQFLEEIGSNDYSLLLGIHNIQNKARASVPFPVGFRKNHINDYSLKNNFNSYTNKFKNSKTISLDKDSDLFEDKDNKQLFKELYDCEDRGIISSNGEKIYYFGIIDILTEYGIVKKAEHFCKMIRYCSENMSCIPPKKYKERFINYMINNVFDDKEFLRKVPINDDVDKNVNKSLYCSQNLNDEINKINKKKALNEDNKSENSDNNNYNKDLNNKNNNINSEGSAQRLNYNKFHTNNNNI